MKLSRPIAIGTAAALTMTAIHAPAYSFAAEQGAFTASNGVTINYVKGSEGDNGAYVFFGGDGTVAQMKPGSPFTTTMSSVTERHGVSGYFLLPPNRDHSWWQGKSFDTLETWCVAVREFINSLETDTVEVMGYSGGAEFIGRHLLRTNTGWTPENFSASMVGGGGTSGNPVTPPAAGKESTPLLWIVGERDTYSFLYPTWSALESSKKSRTAYENAGFTESRIRVLPNTDHYQYDFPELVDDRLKAMNSAPVSAPAPVPAPAPEDLPLVDAGAPVPPPAPAPVPASSSPSAPAPASPVAPAPAPPASGAPAAPSAEPKLPAAESSAPAAQPKRPSSAEDQPESDQPRHSSRSNAVLAQLRRMILNFIVSQYLTYGR